MELSQIDGQIFVSDCPGLALGPHLKIGGRNRGQGGHNPDQLLLAKRHDHPRTAPRPLPIADRIGKRAVQGHGERDFAVSRHERQESV